MTTPKPYYCRAVNGHAIGMVEHDANGHAYLVLFDKAVEHAGDGVRRPGRVYDIRGLVCDICGQVTSFRIDTNRLDALIARRRARTFGMDL